MLYIINDWGSQALHNIDQLAAVDEKETTDIQLMIVIFVFHIVKQINIIFIILFIYLQFMD